MKKFKDLAASDFPSVDVQKFDEWKNAVLDANRRTAIMLIGLVLLNIILFLATGSVILGGLLLFLAFFFIWRKPNRLGKELGMTRAVIKHARADGK